MIEHVGLAAGRWHGLSLAEQLGNVGSEFERALAAKDRGLTDRFDRALTRMLELLDLTLADPRWRGPRRREIARARESVCWALWGDGESRSSIEGLRRYFLAFALLARRGADG